MLSRKHYIAHAAVLNEARADSAHHAALSGPQRKAAVAAIERVAHELAHVYRQDNPRFDTGRFLSACGFES